MSATRDSYGIFSIDHFRPDSTFNIHIVRIGVPTMITKFDFIQSEEDQQRAGVITIDTETRTLIAFEYSSHYSNDKDYLVDSAILLRIIQDADLLSSTAPTFEEVIGNGCTSPGVHRGTWLEDDDEFTVKREFDEHGLVSADYVDNNSSSQTVIEIRRDEISDGAITYSHHNREETSSYGNMCYGTIVISADNLLTYYTEHDQQGDFYWPGPGLVYKLITGTVLTDDLQSPAFIHEQS